MRTWEGRKEKQWERWERMRTTGQKEREGKGRKMKNGKEQLVLLITTTR